MRSELTTLIRVEQIQLLAWLALLVRLVRQELKLLMIFLVSHASPVIIVQMTNLRNSVLWATIALLTQISLLCVL